MKRLVTILALLMVLPAFLCGPATAADIYDSRIVADDHPWGGEDNDPGRYRHINSSDDYVSSGYVPLDIFLNSDFLTSQLESIFMRPDKVRSLEVDVYVPEKQIDQTRQTSAK